MFKQIFSGIKEVVFLLFFLITLSNLTAESRNTEHSFFDFTKEDFVEGSVSLEGAWDFYWNEFFYPGERLPVERRSINIPDAWNSNSEYPVFGFATYGTVIYLPSGMNELGLYIPFTLNHYKLFINGRLIASNGELGSEKGHYTGSVQPSRIIRLTNDVRQEILFLVSNQDDFNGGLTDVLKIGLYEPQILEKNRAETIDAILFGIYLITGMLYMSFFVTRKNDKSSYYFGLFCLVLSLRTILYGEHILIMMFPEIPMELETALGHITYYLAYPLFLRFIAVTYPFRWSRWIEFPSYIIGSLYVLLVIFTRHHFYIFFLTYFQIISLLGGICIILVLVYYFVKKDFSARVTIIGFTVLLATAVNDILYTQNLIQSFHMVPFGLGLFIITQAGLMTWKIAIAFSQAEILSKELTVTNQSFKRFVPEEFLRFLNKQKIADVSLGDNIQMDMSIIFLDIRSFTSMSEDMTPKEIFLFLNSFFERVSPVIRTNGGFIDKYLGDGIMALFPGKADHAVKAAVEILDMLKIYNGHRQKCNYRAVRIGIGIHTGSLMLGTVGEVERMDSTVISDAVNLCARLESITKEYCINIALSEDTYNSMENRNFAEVRCVGKIPLKGKRRPISIFELFNGDDSLYKSKKIKFRNEFEEAVSLLDEKLFAEARKSFLILNKKFPEDKTVEVFLKRIRAPKV